MPKKIQWWVLGSGALMAFGAFRTWVLIESESDWSGWSYLEGTISGTDGSSDGWLVVAAAAIAGGLVFFRRTSRHAGIPALLGGVVGLSVTAYDLATLQRAVGRGSGFEGYTAYAGLGLILALLASISMAIAGIVALRRARSAPAPERFPARSSPTDRGYPG